MDMITKIQLEDAINNKKLVETRVLEVAMIIAKMKGEITGTKWHLRDYHIDFRVPREDMQHLHDVAVRVHLEANWDDRPVTKKFGDPKNDYYGDEEMYGPGDSITKLVEFPIRCLTTTDWEAEVYAKIKKNKLWWANHRIEQQESAVRRREQELKESLEQLEKMRREAKKLEDNN